MFHDQQSTYILGANSFVDSLVLSNLCTAAILLIILGMFMSKSLKGLKGLKISARCPRRKKVVDGIAEVNDQQDEPFLDAQMDRDPEVGIDNQANALEPFDLRSRCVIV